MTDLFLAVYPFNAVKQFWRCCKALDKTHCSEHLLKIGIYAFSHLVRHLPPSIENFWSLFATKLGSPSRNFPKWSVCGRFPYEEDKINEWLDHELPSKDNEKHKVLKIINVDRSGRRNKIYMRGQPASFPMSPENDKFEIFVHGTDHKSAKNIIEEGIRLSEGEDAQDFSDGEGFYLGNNFDEALEWAGHKHMDGEAVLIYEVDMGHLRGDNNENGLDLSNNKRKWLQVVSEYRLSGPGRNEKPPSKALRKELEQYNFIEGPMASVSKKNPRPRQKDGTYQLCIRNTACAALFDRCLSYVIFFER